MCAMAEVGAVDEGGGVGEKEKEEKGECASANVVRGPSDVCERVASHVRAP